MATAFGAKQGGLAPARERKHLEGHKARPAEAPKGERPKPTGNQKGTHGNKNDFGA